MPTASPHSRTRSASAWRPSSHARSLPLISACCFATYTVDTVLGGVREVAAKQGRVPGFASGYTSFALFWSCTRRCSSVFSSRLAA